jgi:hypothetical protein
MTARWIRHVVAVALASGWTSFAVAASPPTPFAVEFSGCVETIGVGLALTDHVVALTPPEFIPIPIGPYSPIVVRTADCAGIAVAGGKARPGTVVQIGAVIVPPAPAGEDIDNYTFWYYTTDEKLARRLQSLGVSAQHAETIRYDLDPGIVGVDNSLFVEVRRPGDPRFTLDGTVLPSATQSGSFEAIWWQKTSLGRIRMDTLVPVIAISSADLVLHTDPANALGALIDGGVPGFAILQQFNLFAAAHMAVGIAP